MTGPADAKHLVGLLRSSIAPKCWQLQGSTGLILYCEKTKSLVIEQSRDIHDRVADLLNSLRQLKAMRQLKK